MLFPLATRAQAVTLKNCGYSYENIEKLTGIKKRQVQYIIDEAKKRGYNPKVDPTLKDESFHDRIFPERPKKLSDEQIVALVAASKHIKGVPRKSNAILAEELGVSERTIRRFKGMKGGYKKAIYRPNSTDSPEANSEAQSEEERDVDMTTTPSTLDQTTSGDSVLDQLHAAAAGDEYSAPKSPQTTSTYTPPSPR
jgi:predicted transcriptional regulator